ncbi:related to ARP8 - Actin-related protein [Melanopsichium pennsylvanicum]|uniref:Related to ARP8 - Actin-related protein n=2 Tax=Melanopsichium pennsylvanicum TaxID=63383 RepID=A0AAJ5C7L8_9BASI|nr:related to ARP8-Actin-related protein [Melanopsichium pennsylvanicum 4]SNX87030.1 related to ARP8 - Actin-related protein [Melanopsichium pennsylvanicum]
MPPKKVSLPPNPPPDPSQNIPLQYTTFFSVAPLNAKNVSSSYLKTESQTWISRSQSTAQPLPQSKKRRLDALRDVADAADGADASINLDDEDDLDADQGEKEAAENTPAHRTIVIHSGSETLRLGRATDLFPISLPNVIARRPTKAASPPLTHTPSQQANGNHALTASTANTENTDDTHHMDIQMADEPRTDAHAGAKADEETEEDAAKSLRKNPRRSAINAFASEKPYSSNIPAAPTTQGLSLNEGIETIRNDLRAIMRQEKLRSVGNAKNLAANYNDSSKPEDVPEHNDLFGLEWIDEDANGDNDVLVGEQALRLACFSLPNTAEPKQQRGRQQQHQTSPVKQLSPPDSHRPWKLFHPFKRGTLDLNTYEEHYGSSAAVQALLGDVRCILERAITCPPEDTDERQETGRVAPIGLGIPRKEFGSCTVILIIPDLFCRSDVKALTELLLVDMGFAQACVQQESVCATFGAGLSSGCVVDMGSEKISISCVEEGLILPETRIQLSYGGRDLTHFLAELFIRAKFPYRELDYASNIADAMLIDELKRKLITLNPADVGLNIHDFYLRLPSRPTMKYLFRTYDELIMGPMSLFDPQVFDLDAKKMLKGKSRGYKEDEGAGDEGVAEDSPELSVLRGLDISVTTAMTSCVKHLLPPPPAAPIAKDGTAGTDAGAAAAAAARGSEIGTPAPPATEGNKTNAGDSAMPSRASSPAMNTKADGDASMLASANASARPSPAPQPANANSDSIAPPPAEPVTAPLPTIDIYHESSKTPLDTALFHSLVTSIGQVGPAGDERLRKMSNNILCVGGSARIPGLGAALEARLTAMLGNHFAITTGDAGNAPKVTVIPPPRDMDPQVMAWKGMSVFARLEAASAELCLRKEDWIVFGWRALREKTLFL